MCAKGNGNVKSCGSLNDVSGNNIFDLLEMAARGITQFTTKPLRKPNDDS